MVADVGGAMSDSECRSSRTIVITTFYCPSDHVLLQTIVWYSIIQV